MFVVCLFVARPSKSNLLLRVNDLVAYGLGSASNFVNVDLECAMHVCILIQKMIPNEKVNISSNLVYFNLFDTIFCRFLHHYVFMSNAFLQPFSTALG